MVRLCQTSIKLSCSSRFRHSSADTLHKSFLLCSSDLIECSTPSPKLWKTMKKYKTKKMYFQFWIQGPSIYPPPPIGFPTLSTVPSYFVYKSSITFQVWIYCSTWNWNGKFFSYTKLLFQKKLTALYLKKKVRTHELWKWKQMNPQRHPNPIYSLHQSLYMELFHQLFLKKDEKRI